MKYVIIWAAALTAIACGLLVCESHFLWKVQELNLFLHTSLFFKQQMVVPAGFLTYIGTWFTQFFYYPWMGVAMLCAWWLLLLFLLKRAFDVPARWASLLLIPVALLLLTDVYLGYWIYLLKLRGHFFLTTIATTMVVSLLWSFRSLPDKYWMRSACMVLTCVVGYPLMGIYGLAATLLMGVWSWRLMPYGRAAVYTLIAIFTAVAIPLFCYRYIYHETNLANIYYAGLPLFFITKEYALYYIPYYLLALFMVVMVCLSRRSQDSGVRSKEIWNKAWIPWIVQAAVLGVVAWGVVHFWYKDENFHHEVKMQHLIDETDWEGVLQEAATQDDEPTRAIVMMRNLALSRLGRQGELMYQYRNGAKFYDGPSEMSTLMVIGTMIYYQYGLLNPCNRLCTEMGVEFEWRAEHFQYLIRCAILKGEKKIARKYINILKRTQFFDEWAAKAEDLLNTPQLIAKDREMEPVTHMLHYSDVLNSDNGNLERFVMNLLAKSNDSKDLVFQEQSLLATLWVKDPQLFWHHFNKYVELHPNAPMPVTYQEAAYLFGQIVKHPDLDRMPFSPGIKESFDKFYRVFSQYEGMNVEDVRQQVGMLYSNNFYYDYHLMSNLPEY